MKVHRLNQNQLTRFDVIRDIGAGILIIGAGILIFTMIMICAWMFLSALPDPAHGGITVKPKTQASRVAPDPAPAPDQDQLVETLPATEKRHRDPEKIDALDVLGNIVWALTFLL